MNRKIISLLAILAMLCSMVVFEMPAIAEDASSEDTALSSILADIAEGGTELKKLLENADADEQTIIAAAQSDKDGITWNAFEWDVNDYPRYAYHKVYEAAGYAEGEAVKKWSITAQADWEAMREVADSVNATLGSEGKNALKDAAGNYVDYFVDTEFHLTNDIDFSYPEYFEDKEEYAGDDLESMGFSIYNEGGGFAGTINGHGYGFNNIYIQSLKKEILTVDSSGKEVEYKNSFLHSGLFHRLANCKFIDFGLNSGFIYQNSGGGSNCVSSFGNVIAGAVPEFTRVWSSVCVAPLCGAQGTAMVGSFDEKAITVKVNGYVFDGAIVKGQSTSHGGQNSFALYSGGGEFKADYNKFYNIITDYQSCNGKVSTGHRNGVLRTSINSDTGDSYTRGGRSALFGFSSVAAFIGADIQNVYAVKREIEGINEGYTLGRGSNWGGYDSDSLLTDMSAAEVAWTINNKNLNGDVPKDVEPVYFKMNTAGQVRPTTDQTNRVVKVTLKYGNGMEDKNVYLGAHTPYSLKDKLGDPATHSFEFVDGKLNVDYNVDSNNQFYVDRDFVVNVTINCKHIYKYEPGKNVHTKTCTTCGYECEEPCSAEEYALDDITADAATHSGTCDCGATVTQNCNFEYNKATNKYVCADCDRKEEALAPMVPGDVDGNSNFTIFDAIQLLKNTVDPSVSVNEHNADVDGNNRLDVLDAVKIVKLALGDKKTKAEMEKLAELVNESNYYSKVGVVDDGATLTMDGVEKYSFNDRYVLTKDISGISNGNKITFGPVRLGQAVMGYFYDAKGNPQQLINHTNVKVEHQFKQGMVMVSVRVPQGASAVRFQVNAEEKDRFYIRINNDFTVADYQYRANLKEATLENPLEDQLLLTVGDSLCAAADLKRDSKPDGNLKGWARRIYQQFGAKVINSAEGGSAISVIKFKPDSIQTDTEPLSSRQCIVNQLSEHTNIGREFEYILLEGAGNDSANGAAIGSVSPFYDPASFNMTTYAGGLEMMIYTAIKEHGDTAAIGYMSYYDMPYAKHEGMHRNHEYFAVGKQICEKWGIEYLDMNTILTEDIFNSKSTTNYGSSYPVEDHYDANAHTHDAIHANDDGYDIMQSYINAFLPQMRPASKKIYDIVQRYDYEVPEFDEFTWDGSTVKG